jgi:hypothetical protein
MPFTIKFSLEFSSLIFFDKDIPLWEFYIMIFHVYMKLCMELSFISEKDFITAKSRGFSPGDPVSFHREG